MNPLVYCTTSSALRCETQCEYAHKLVPKRNRECRSMITKVQPVNFPRLQGDRAFDTEFGRAGLGRLAPTNAAMVGSITAVEHTEPGHPHFCAKNAEKFNWCLVTPTVPKTRPAQVRTSASAYAANVKLWQNAQSATCLASATGEDAKKRTRAEGSTPVRGRTQPEIPHRQD
jgi:hypothetical protein